MIKELFHANPDYRPDTMNNTKSEIINLISSNGFTISETETIFEQILAELIYKLKINKDNLQ